MPRSSWGLAAIVGVVTLVVTQVVAVVAGSVPGGVWPRRIAYAVVSLAAVAAAVVTAVRRAGPDRRAIGRVAVAAGVVWGVATAVLVGAVG